MLTAVLCPLGANPRPSTNWLTAQTCGLQPGPLPLAHPLRNIPVDVMPSELLPSSTCLTVGWFLFPTPPARLKVEVLPWATVISPVWYSILLTSWGRPCGWRGMRFLQENVTGPKLLRRILYTSWAQLNDALLVPENVLTFLSPLDACLGHASNLTFPLQVSVKRLGWAALSSALNEPHARAPMISFLPSGIIWVPVALPFAQTSEEGAVALMREVRFPIWQRM